MKDEKDEFEIPWLGIVLFCVAIGLAVFVLNAMGYVTMKTWGPMYEEARRETFEQSPSFIRGKQQYLVRLHGEWLLADEAHRGAICSVARNEAVPLKTKDLPEMLKEWSCVK
jgi:hypothetical protein